MAKATRNKDSTRAERPFTYADLDNEIFRRATHAGNVAMGLWAPMLAFIAFGAIGGMLGYVFGSRMDAVFIGICFGIAGAFVVHAGACRRYCAWGGFIPGFLFGAGIMLTLELVFAQSLASFWFIPGIVIGAGIDHYFKKRFPDKHAHENRIKGAKR